MHPAPSIIVFSTFSGAGFGLMAVTGVMAALGFGPQDTVFVAVVSVLALGLAVVGLCASTLHLRRPERAWRAFSQWRSSWLSREGWAAVATLVVFALFGGAHVVLGLWLPALGLVAAALALGTVLCTAMIYAQLRTVPRWHTALTPVAFIAIALANGAFAYATVAAWFGSTRWLAALALVLRHCLRRGL